jgi:hypothetical protein
MEAVAADVDQCTGGCKPRTPTCGRDPLIKEADTWECDEKPNHAHMLIVDPAPSLRNLMSIGNEGALRRSAYEFIKGHRDQYSVQMMCRVLEVAPSGYYDWPLQPISNRGQEDARQLRLMAP